MRAGFYPKLALDGIRKNKQLYLPYILTCIGMVMMHYIIGFLQYSNALLALPGAATIESMIDFGGWVIAVFACIFLFYTNAFLIRRRKKEFGLYNILGMGKRNIGRILFWEVLLIFLLSLGIGLFAGIALSKLAELGLVNLVQGKVSYTLTVSHVGIVRTVEVFSVIFVLLFLNALRQVRFSSAISLLRSENVGEKPPKGNWFTGILGVLLLAAAYYISVTIKDPIAALAVFFGAVLMVIVGTYLLMISGSVLLCRMLQKKKNYYYKPNHFVSVSSMVYRMKRNGAGLASICILVTMVLVMISSATSLFFGNEDVLYNRYPREINLDFVVEQTDGISDEAVAAVRNEIFSVARKQDAAPKNLNEYRSATFAGLMEGTVVETDVSKVDDLNLDTFSNIYQFSFIPLSDYNAMMETSETLGEEEVLLYTDAYEGDTISFHEGKTFQIKKQIEEFAADNDAATLAISSMVIVVPDLEESIKGLDRLADYNGNRMITLRYTCNFDTGADAKKQETLYRELCETFYGERAHEAWGITDCYCESREMNRADFYGLYGGILYLGILLSIVFIFAAVLIIYYKQISEGYEDATRFEIMQKVGMTGREIRKSINSQLLTVFFFPLILAACHLAFAFPIIRKLLLLFNLNNVTLYAATTIISVLIFAIFYMLVYRVTSNAYYRIVSGAKED